MTKVLFGFLITMVVSCAAGIIIPTLKNRTLYPCKDGLCYQYCTKYKFFNRDECKKDHWKVDHYDMSKPEVVEKLKAYGFTCTSERRGR